MLSMATSRQCHRRQIWRAFLDLEAKASSAPVPYSRLWGQVFGENRAQKHKAVARRLSFIKALEWSRVMADEDVHMESDEDYDTASSTGTHVDVEMSPTSASSRSDDSFAYNEKSLVDGKAGAEAIQGEVHRNQACPDSWRNCDSDGEEFWEEVIRSAQVRTSGDAVCNGSPMNCSPLMHGVV